MSNRAVRVLTRQVATSIVPHGALRVLDDEKEAAAWLNEPLSVLGGRTPLSLCATEAGAREVEQILGRIEHGVFS